MKATTKSRAPQAATLRDLIVKAGMKPVDVASRARVSTATVYRGIKGLPLSGLQSWAIATVLGVNEDTLRAAILASAKGAA